MKLFLLIIFMVMQVGSFATGNSIVEKNGRSYFTGAENTQLVDHNEQDLAAILTTNSDLVTKQFKNTTRFRQHHFAGGLSNEQYLNHSITHLEDTFFVARYSYCKPIGLFLIFPEHYFW